MSIVLVEGESDRIALEVLAARLGIRLTTADVFTLGVGGVRLSEPAADLAVGLAVVSSSTGGALDPGFGKRGKVTTPSPQLIL